MITIERKIILSEKVKEYIPENVTSDHTLIFTADIQNDLKGMLSDKEERVNFVVIFLPAEEYFDLVSFLDIFVHKNLFYQLVIFGKPESIKDLMTGKLYRISDFRSVKITQAEFDFITSRTLSLINEYYNNMLKKNEYLARLNDTRQDQEDLINIGKALSSEKDMEKLLRLILFFSKRITGADAGSIYLVETDDSGEKRLRFKYSHTFSREIPLEEFTMPMDKRSIAGYVAVTGEVLNISDAYNLQGDAPYSFNSSFDEQHNYICRSMLVVPMRNHIGEIIGVIQLINSKEDLSRKENAGSEAFTIKLLDKEDFDKHVVTFDKEYDSLLEAIAGEAAVAIENNRLIRQIQNQFEEFVRASVTAIESRDPATSGHSFRVAEICKHLAEAVNRVDTGYLKDFSFDENAVRELEFAALLHDFGKVYIDLAIFMKDKKLFPEEFRNLVLRLQYLYRFVELQYNAKESSLLTNKDSMGKFVSEFKSLITEKEEKLNVIKSIIEKITKLNEPTVTEEDPEEILERILEQIDEIECYDIDGKKMDIITDKDKLNLTIKRGSLNPIERKEIESHVVHTYSFVSKIPWPPEYKNIPEIALRHHEQLDGSGYPDGMKGRESISLQSRMMSIADIYDALSAHDRPYKKGVPLERILKILSEEAERGKLDKDLVELFIKEKIYEKVK